MRVSAPKRVGAAGVVSADANSDRRELASAEKVHETGEVHRQPAPLAVHATIHPATLEADDRGMDLIDLVRLERAPERAAQVVLKPVDKRRETLRLGAVMCDQRELHRDGCE